MDGTPITDDCLRNDVHSALNRTRHSRVLAPCSAQQVSALLRAAAACGQRVAIAGAQHAMGGQQFADQGWLLDMRELSGVLDFDAERGLVRVAAGTRWPELQAFLREQRRGNGHGWAIRQKQTGADDFSLGGAVAANIHGRGLNLPPFVDDIERIRLVTPDGAVVEADRRQHSELFARVVGGYGLFGVVTEITLRLVPRQCLQRRVHLLPRSELADAFATARSTGAVYGDFQFAIDPGSSDFLNLGVYACYYPVDQPMPLDHPALHLAAEDWQQLLLLAHTDKAEAFRHYSRFYLATDGQHYASDDHQFGVYLDGYHRHIDSQLGHVGSEVITELYVPLADLDAFLGTLAEDCRTHAVDLIYGTVRLIRRDTETMLAWARQDWACVVLNVHVHHDAPGQAKAATDFQRLIDRALAFGGSFYLTYHRHADAAQLRAAYPHIDAFVAAKEQHDPGQVLVSDWYRDLRAKLARA